MSIVVIQVPRHAESQRAAVSDLLRKSHADGKQLLVRTSATLQELIRCLRELRAADTEFVLLDSGEVDPRECGQNNGDLCRALDELPSPYIEMHDDSGQTLDLLIHPDHAPLVTVVVKDDPQTSYSLAYAIALRHLHKSGAATADDQPA